MPKRKPQLIEDIIKRFSGQKNHIGAPRLYIDLCGDHCAAILLNQIVYWSGITTDPEGWIAKSYDDWYQEIRLSKYQVSRAINGDKRCKQGGVTLRDLGIETVMRRSRYYNGAGTLHYRVNWERFEAVLADFMARGVDNVDSPGVDNVDTSGVNNVDTYNKDYAETTPVSEKSCNDFPAPRSPQDADFVNAVTGQEEPPEPQHGLVAAILKFARAEVLTGPQIEKLSQPVRHFDTGQKREVVLHPSYLAMWDHDPLYREFLIDHAFPRSAAKHTRGRPARGTLVGNARNIDWYLDWKRRANKGRVDSETLNIDPEDVILDDDYDDGEYA